MSHQLPAIIVVLPLVVSFFIFFLRLVGEAGRFPPGGRRAGLLRLTLPRYPKFGDQRWHDPILDGWMGPPVGDRVSGSIISMPSCWFWSQDSACWRPFIPKNLWSASCPEKPLCFGSLFILLITGLLGICITGDLFNLFVLLEVASLSGYALVAIGKDQATVASFRYLIMGTIGASFYLLGVGYLYISTGSLNMEDLRMLLPSLYASPGGSGGLCVHFHRICHQNRSVPASFLATGCIHLCSLGGECAYLHRSGEDFYLRIDSHHFFSVYIEFHKRFSARFRDYLMDCRRSHGDRFDLCNCAE